MAWTPTEPELLELDDELLLDDELELDDDELLELDDELLLDDELELEELLLEELVLVGLAPPALTSPGRADLAPQPSKARMTATGSKMPGPRERIRAPRSPPTPAGIGLSVMERLPSWRLAILHQGARKRHAACVPFRRDASRCSSKPSDGDGDGTIGGGAVAELAELVVPPAQHRAGGGEGARVVQARGDGTDAGGQALHADGDVAGHRGVVAELAVAVVPPADDGAGGGDGARVVQARGDREDAGGQALNGDRDGALGDGAVAELSESVVPPTQHRAG
jgi:hypothetical protein